MVVIVERIGVVKVPWVQWIHQDKSTRAMGISWYVLSEHNEISQLDWYLPAFLDTNMR